MEMPLTTPKRFVSMICNPVFQCLCMPWLHAMITLWKYSVSSHPLFRPMPAFSIRKLTCPKSISTLALKSLHSSILLTSIAYVCVSLPLSKCERAAERASVFRSTRASFIPCLWQSLATARPMPEAAPVIRAVAEFPALKTGCKGIFEEWKALKRDLEGLDWWG